MEKKICIDAGHYGKYNRSPVAPEYYESDMVWKLHLMEKELLEGYGFTVILTRDNQETDRALYDRGHAAQGCVLFMSDHSNACQKETVDYPVVYRAFDDRGDADVLGLRIADVIAETMGTKQGGRTATRRGESGDEYYGVLRGARAAGLDNYYIVEHSFHTNPEAVRWLLKDENLRKLAEAKCRVIAEYFGIADTDSMIRITGKASATTGQMQAYIKETNADVDQSVIDMIPLYLEEGRIENIRGDIAFAQSCLETGNFTFDGSAVTLGQNNFCGMGVTRKGMKGNRFDTPQLGIRAQVQHLKAYADISPLVNECVDPRYQYVERGCAPYLEWLGQKENPSGKGWATGKGYGNKISEILSKILKKGDDQDGNVGEGAPEQTGAAKVKVKELKGSLEITYKGEDGLNIRTSPCMGDNISQVVHGGLYIVTGISEDGDWYRLRSGLFISSNKEYVDFRQAWTAKVSVDALNIRPLPGLEKPAVGCIRDRGVYTVVRNVNGWGMLFSGQGYIRLSYTKPVGRV